MGAVNRPKSAWAVVDHRARRAALQMARLAGWWVAPRAWPAPRRYEPARDGRLDWLAQSVRLSLGPEAQAQEGEQGDAGFGEAALAVGKRTNLALAAPAFDGLVVTPDRPLSFWRTLGRATEQRGYTWGRELRGGCVVPAIAGGLCLLSNALFESAVRAGWRIVERHGHSLEAMPPAPGAIPLDATVAWPDVDLVVAPARGRARLSVRIEGDALRVAIFTEHADDERIELSHQESIVRRGADRLRSIRVWRRRIDGAGTVIATEEVARSRRRILAADELGKTCLSCGEAACRDRPAEAALVALRALGKKG
jgi:vancomycin resistance protein VanW